MRKNYWPLLLLLVNGDITLNNGPFTSKLTMRALNTHNNLQLKGVSKLLGLDYKILYRKGSKNKVADALSRRPMVIECLAVQTVTILQPTWLSSLVASYTGDEHANNLKSQLAIDSNA